MYATNARNKTITHVRNTAFQDMTLHLSKYRTREPLVGKITDLYKIILNKNFGYYENVWNLSLEDFQCKMNTKIFGMIQVLLFWKTNIISNSHRYLYVILTFFQPILNYVALLFIKTVHFNFKIFLY